MDAESKLEHNSAENQKNPEEQPKQIETVDFRLKDFWDTQDVSKYLGIKPSTVYAMVEARKISHFKVGRLIRFRKADVDLWMGQNQVQCVDPGKMARKSLAGVHTPKLDIDRAVQKAIDRAKAERYTPSHGKTRPTKGPREGGL